MDLPTAVTTWYRAHGRDLPFRQGRTSAWGVLVCEVMSQQTPVARVLPRWEEWMQRWPEPADLAAASPAEVLRAWGSLGYPRRALRLRECASVVVEKYDGDLPRTETELRSLPGIGQYTAAAVVAFAYRQRSAVLDTNVRRVLARLNGQAGVPAHLTRAEVERAWEFVPVDPEAAACYNEAMMELGALVCTSRNPRCPQCPLAAACVWYERGCPAGQIRPRTQAWEGTDRQVRGRIMAALRANDDDVRRRDLLAAAATSPSQAERALAGLLADGLIARTGEHYHLPLG